MKIKTAVEATVLQLWYSGSLLSKLLAVLLLPLSALFSLITQQHKQRLLAAQVRTQAAPVVIVVGNISVGGTGKTPLIVELTQVFMARGYQVGILSRGHGGAYLKQAEGQPQHVTVDSDPNWVGDEPVMMAEQLARLMSLMELDRTASRPAIVCCADRNRGLASLYADQSTAQQPKPTVILVDDGLQHYALARDIEIAVVDGQRGFGNGYLLPAGPLREAPTRLCDVDLVLINGKVEKSTELAVRAHTEAIYSFSIEAIAVIPLNQSAQTMLDRVQYSDGLPSRSLATAQNSEDVIALLAHADVQIVAVAGLGNPKRFFQTLTQLFASTLQQRGDTFSAVGKTVNHEVIFSENSFPDHYCYSIDDFDFVADNTVIIMTAKDAVKCAKFAGQLSCPIFVLEVGAKIEPEFTEALMTRAHACGLAKR